ncbi:DUF3793 family protein [Natronincola ferrireducens]|uniref:DUF3793 family protein n=1 Tax=Natronincola ferrireducens TaxID=393762 RepID=A0A1G8Y958_9FIRM|nr:DUF3793 family protein [Natronincola ferrireducens]SDJ99217.1 Protein of unknown function [Natronincola ferrireducens]
METNSKYCYCLNQNSDYEFIKWIVELLGPVLLGVKPSEIVSFPGKDKTSLQRREAVKLMMDMSPRVSFREIDFSNRCNKILFYHVESLNHTLKEFRNLRFLKTLGYPEDYNLQIYLDHMIYKMQGGEIPHEIGVFLGYPLKDVLGFMGHPSLKLTKTNGWKVYGDPRLSDEKHRRILCAKEKVKKMLEINPPEKIIQTA